jgi:hypothetical protein
MFPPTHDYAPTKPKVKEVRKLVEKWLRFTQRSRMSICILILRSETLRRWRPSGIGSRDVTDESEPRLVREIAGYLMVKKQ